MANLGNVGKTFPVCSPNMANTVFDQAKEPTSVTMHAVSSVPGAIAALFRRGVIIPTTGAAGGRTRVDGSGNINFYDMEDSLNDPYYFYTIGTGEDWQATVVGAVVVVTQLHAANRATANAFT